MPASDDITAAIGSDDIPSSFTARPLVPHLDRGRLYALAEVGASRHITCNTLQNIVTLISGH